MPNDKLKKVASYYIFSTWAYYWNLKQKFYSRFNFFVCKAVFTLAKCSAITPATVTIVLALATLGSATEEIGSFLSFLHRQRWLRQVLFHVANGFAYKLCQCKQSITGYYIDI
jgi:hypothetical protein